MNDPAYPANFALQAIVLSAVALGVVACLRRPERRACAALVGMLACGVIPFLSAFAPVKERAKDTVERGRVIQIDPLPQVETVIPAALLEPVPVSSEPAGPHASPVRRLDPVSWILLTWLAGGLASGLLMGRELIRTRHWVRSLGCPDEVGWEKLWTALPQEFARDRIRISADASGPCVIGFRKPRIVIPKWLLETNFRRELDWTLRHELEHLRCHDSRWIHVIRVIRIIQWWNPLLHLLAGVWSQSREQACDLRAVRDADERPDYGHFLLKVAGGKASRFATAMAVTIEMKRLRRRIVSLLKSRSPKPSPAGIGWSMLMAGGMIVVAFLASPFGFAQAPVETAPGSVVAADDANRQSPNPGVYIQAVVLISPEPFGQQGEVLTDEDVKDRISRFTGKPGFHLQYLSPDGMQNGGHLTLRLTSDSGDSPWDGSNQAVHFVGWVVRYQTQAKGDRLNIGVKAAYAFPRGSHPAPSLFPQAPVADLLEMKGLNRYGPLELPTGMTWGDIVLRTADESASIPSGKILCTTLGEVESGVYAVCLTGARTRIAGERSMPSGFPCLTAPAAPEDNPFRTDGISQFVRYTTEQQAEAKRIEALQGALAAKVVTHPANQGLVRIKAGLNEKLSDACFRRDAADEGYLRWRIESVDEQMRKNLGTDYDIEHNRIQELWLKLEKSLNRPGVKIGWERRFNPKHFKANEE